MNKLTESMTKFRMFEYTIRCWREEPVYNGVTAYKTRVEIHTFLSNDNVRTELKQQKNCFGIANALLEMERMNAVEVLLPEGDGCVVYKDWP